MLYIIQVGHVEASDRYIRSKVKAIEAAGLKATVINLDSTTSTEQLVATVNRMSHELDCCALMVQLPLPEHIDKAAVLKAIPAGLDIDGLNPHSAYKPLTPCAIMRWLKEHGVKIEGKDAVIIGRSELVGKPIANMLVDAGATVTVCNSRTDRLYLGYLCRSADIVISAVGKANLLDSDDFVFYRPQTVIDVGINRNENGKLCGDVSKCAADKITHSGGYCSPVPGGVGKWTVNELVIRLTEMESAYAV